MSLLLPRFLLCAALGVTWSTLAIADSSYDQVRLQYQATPVPSITQLRSQLAALDGKAVELQGEVTGTMARDTQRIVMFKVGEEMTLLTAPPALASSPFLRAGTLVRAVAQVQDDGSLVLLAVTEGVPLAPLPKPDETVQLLAADFSSSVPMTTNIIGSLPQAPEISVPEVKSSARPAAQPPSAGDIEQLVQEQIPAYAAIVRQHNKKLKPNVVEEIATAILRAGFKHNMDPRFIAAIIAVESDFDVYCLSKSGAMGLGQLMPFNLKEAGVKNAWNPTENIMGTAKLLRGHLNDYKNRPNSTLLAVAAYNAGPGAVRRAGYKVPNGKQVQRYVWKVYYRYKAFAPDLFK
jgi:hypothetical protein